MVHFFINKKKKSESYSVLSFSSFLENNFFSFQQENSPLFLWQYTWKWSSFYGSERAAEAKKAPGKG